MGLLSFLRLRGAAPRPAASPTLEQLRLSEAKFAGIVSIAADAIISVDRDQRIILFNEGAERIFGYRAAEIMGRPLDVLLPERFRTVHGRHVERFAHAREAARRMGERQEIFGLRRSGGEFPAEASISRLEVGGQLIFTVLLRDITEHKRAEQALRTREKQLAYAQQIAKLGSWEWDVATDTITWSAELYRIYGVEIGRRVEFQSFLDRIHPDDREMVQKTVVRALEEGTPFAFDHAIVRPDGSVRNLHGRGEVVMDEAGRPVRMVGTAQDITERKQAEERARELARAQAARAEAEAAARRMEFLASASRQLGASLDHEQIVRALARAAVPTLGDFALVLLPGYEGAPGIMAGAHRDPARESQLRQLEPYLHLVESPGNLVGRVFATGRPEVFNELTAEIIAQRVPEPAPRRGVAELAPHAVLAVPLKTRERTLGVLALVMAESGRKFSPDDVAMAEELAYRAAVAVDNARLYRDVRDANRVKSDFLTIMSHELRTPLNAVIGYADLLQMGVAGSLNEAQVGHVERVKSSARHLLQLIEEILNYARIEAGREEIRLEALDVASLVRESAALIEPAAVEKGLALHVSWPADVVRITTDGRKVRQILANLLSNAVKFTDAGEIRLEAAHEPGGAVFRVSDTGIGIPAEQLERVFEPFVQVEAATTRKLGGSGLGLSVTRKLARLLGGDVAVESSVDHGTTFTVQLPVAIAIGMPGTSGGGGADRGNAAAD